jgi:DNA-binding response OmpR family regulator
MELKVFLLGSSKAEQKLKATLNGKRVHLTRVADLAEAVRLLDRENCDVFMVDSAVENAHIVCRTVGNLGHIPLVLYVSGRKMNWKKLTSLHVDGYLSYSVGGAELAARLQAVVRRHSSNPKMGKYIPEPRKA